MFNALKSKFNDIVKKFSKETEKPMYVEKEEESTEEKSKSVLSKVKKAITTSKINNTKFEEIFEELEINLLQNNIAIEVVEKIKENLKVDIVDIPIEKNKIKTIIEDNLKQTIKELFNEEQIDIIEKIKNKKPQVILFLGVNGAGKTTTISKIAKILKTNNLKSVLVAADTFRAAAIDQLQYHAEKLEIPIIKHNYGSDPAAVAFDAVKYAKSKNLDVVLIDSAGRMHSNINLMDELKKIVRVVKPDLKIFVGESITGNDCIEQAKKFEETVGLDGIILTKADVDEKGGAAISISYVTGKPIMYLGTGQNYGDIEKFNIDKLMESLGW
jgi:fused signal recognition particle receptor